MEIINLEKIKPKQTENLKIFLYGDSGVGKTTYATTFPGKKLIISTDGRFKNLPKENRVNTDAIYIPYEFVDENGIKRQGWEEFKKIVNVLVKDDGKEYKTVILDVIADVYEMCRQKILKELGIGYESESSFGLAWAKVNSEFYPVIKKLLGLKANVIVIAHEEVKESKTTPNIPGKVIVKLQGYVQLNGRMINLQGLGEDGNRQVYYMGSLTQTGANIVGVERPLEPTYKALIEEINKHNEEKEEKGKEENNE